MNNFFLDLLFPQSPKFPNTKAAKYEELLDEGLTMGTLIIGHPGSGKTTMLARHIVDSFIRHRDQAIFVLDWSGSISKEILHLLAKDTKLEDYFKDIYYDRLGDPEWVLTMPEFVPGENHEIQIQRVTQNLIKLSDNLVKDAPIVAGLGLREIAPQVMRLAMVSTNELREPMQATELKFMLTDKAHLRQLCAKYGHLAPTAKWYLEKKYIPLADYERELRTYTIISLLGAIETDESRARIGYYRRSYSVAEIIKTGGLVLVDGSRLNNQLFAQHYHFTQVYSLIISEINKREPGDPNNKPVKIVADELAALLENPAMADEVGKISPLYRARKLQLYVVIQALWQLSEKLREQIWSLGNIVSFQVLNFEEAYKVAQQVFPYQPAVIKAPGKTMTSQDLYESDRGQYLQYTNQIQHFKHRECIVRRYLKEAKMDDYTYWVKKTKDIPQRPEVMTVPEIKDYLLRTRGLRVREALAVVNQRIPTGVIRTPNPPKVG